MRDPVKAAAHADRNRQSAKRFYHENKERHYARTKAWQLANPEKRKEQVRRHYLKSIEKRWLQMYGIGVPEYEEMLVAQGGRCAVCGGRPIERRLSIDHDHETNAVRGLLHATCNTLIGLGRDDPAILADAAAYLERAA